MVQKERLADAPWRKQRDGSTRLRSEQAQVIPGQVGPSDFNRVKRIHPAIVVHCRIYSNVVFTTTNSNGAVRRSFAHSSEHCQHCSTFAFALPAPNYRPRPIPAGRTPPKQPFNRPENRGHDGPQ
jgi:hypothetical protein